MDTKFSPFPTIMTTGERSSTSMLRARPYWPDYCVLIALPTAAGGTVGYFFELREPIVWVISTESTELVIGHRAVIIFRCNDFRMSPGLS